jgi:hypothetical protein
MKRNIPLYGKFEAISAFHRLWFISNTVILWYISLIDSLKTVCKAEVYEAKSNFCYFLGYPFKLVSEVKHFFPYIPS